MKLFWKKKGEVQFKEAKPKGVKRRKFKKGIAKGVSFVCGGTHFVLDSAATLTVLGEAKAVHALTGKEQYAVIEDRHNSTMLKQEFIADSINKIVDSITDALDIQDQEAEENVTQSEINAV